MRSPKMSTSPVPSKRKRGQEDADDTQQLQIDLSLPEPLSKKALRKAKKAKSSHQPDDQKQDRQASPCPENGIPQSNTNSQSAAKDTTKERSQWGIWIGNLPWSMSKADLREFLCTNSHLQDGNITRVHMPAPKDSKLPSKPKNKCFAYVDFQSEHHLDMALQLSEKLFQGRPVLIKNACSFEGRPEKPQSHPATSTKPPNKRIFVGNLSFDATKEDLDKHFAQCGDVAHVHIATFEDTGKCKGFAWVTFTAIESAQSAVRGHILPATATGKPAKKHYVNKLEGRPLRCEFAEDASVRYNKRFGSGKRRPQEDEAGDAGDAAEADRPASPARPPPSHAPTNAKKAKTDMTPHERRLHKRKQWQHDKARTNTLPPSDYRPPKVSGAIVQAQGKKISFD